MKKKLLSFLLVLTMVAGLFAGCGGNNQGSENKGTENNGSEVGGSEEDGYSTTIDMEGDPYTVAIQVVVLPGADFSAFEETMETALNDITVPAINCKVDIQFTWISEVANKTATGVAGGEKFDLIHVATVQQLSSIAGSDLLLDMNEGNLLKNRGPKLVELFEETLGAGNVGGQQLAVPARIYSGNARGFYYNKGMATQYGIEIPEKITMDEFDQILRDAKAKLPSDVMPYYTGTGELNYLYWLQSYDTFGAESAYGVVLDVEKDPTVVNLYETDMFKNYCLKAWEWTQAGIQPGDSTDDTPAQDYFNAGKLFGVVATLNPEQNSTYASTAAAANIEFAYSMLVEPTITNADIVEYMWGIASNSERPDKAMDFLNLLYSNADVANILKFGVEGTNYEFVGGSDKIIAPVMTGFYLPLFYQGGDYAQMLIQAPSTEAYIEELVEFQKDAKLSILAGYMFNDADFQTEKAVLNTTILEYLPRLQNGMCDSKEATLELIDEFVSKLKANGIDDVIAANQEQLDAYLAK